MSLMKPQQADTIPKGENLIHEIKYDGGSGRIKVFDGKVEVYHSDHNDLMNHKYPEIIDDLKLQGNGIYIVELCVIDDKHIGGHFPNYLKRQCEDYFKIQRRMKEFPLTVMIHDIISDNGSDIMNLSLKERKAILEKKVRQTDHVKLVKSWEPDKLVEFGNVIEGVVTKNLDSLYLMNKRIGWWKTRFNKEETVKCISYEVWRKGSGEEGIIMFTEDGRKVNLSGPRQHEAKQKIDSEGFAMVELSYHEKNENGFRFTTVKRVL